MTLKRTLHFNFLDKSDDETSKNNFQRLIFVLQSPHYYYLHTYFVYVSNIFFSSLSDGRSKNISLLFLYCTNIFVEIFLEQREVAFLSPCKICENLNFSTVHQILLGDKNATYRCSKVIST